MKVAEAIKRIDTLKPNQYTDNEKVEWLSTLDLMIVKDIIEKHKVKDGEADYSQFDGYDVANIETDDLVVPAPYDEDIYINFLSSKIDFYNNEIGKYNNSISLFNSAFDGYAKKYHREHLPTGKSNLKYF